MPPSENDIMVEVKKLIALKVKVRQFTALDQNNWSAVEAQIEVLVTPMVYNEVYTNFGADEHLLDHALIAYNWMVGVAKEPPSADWESLMTPEAHLLAQVVAGAGDGT